MRVSEVNRYLCKCPRTVRSLEIHRHISHYNPPPSPGPTRRRTPPVNMRAALFLTTTLVVANARSKWRADRAMLPTLALYQGSQRTTLSHTIHSNARTLWQLTWPSGLIADGCLTQQATHARTAHHRTAATYWDTLQRSAANFPHIFRPCATPARLPLLCCAVTQPCKPQHASTTPAKPTHH